MQNASAWACCPTSTAIQPWNWHADTLVRSAHIYKKCTVRYWNQSFWNKLNLFNLITFRQAEVCVCITSGVRCLLSVWATVLFSSRVRTVTSGMAGTLPQYVRFLQVSQPVCVPIGWMCSCVYTSCESLKHVIVSDILILFHRSTQAYIYIYLCLPQAVIWRSSIIRSLQLCWHNQWIRDLRLFTSWPVCAPFAWVSSKAGGPNTGKPRHSSEKAHTLPFKSLGSVFFFLEEIHTFILQ